MSKLYFVQVCCLHYMTKCLTGYDASKYICEKSPTYLRYLFYWHISQRMMMCSKMDQQYISILHAPKLDIG